MPGYGLLPAEQGSGLLPWAWAEQRLIESRNYWIATACPDGRPHIMPIWGMWEEDTFWFSSSTGSRKSRNLLADPRCSITTEDAADPVVVEGVAELVTERADLVRVLALENAKYDTDYSIDLLDPNDNLCFRVRPRWAFALRHDDFTGSPPRWRFGGGGQPTGKT